MRRCLLVGLVALTACQPRVAVVRVTIPNLDGVEVPVPGLVVAFLPYDRDSIVAALEAKSPPRPHTRALDSLYAEFREPYRTLARLAAVTERLRREEDSLGRALGDSVRLRTIADSLAVLTATERAARAALERARETLGPRIDQLRAEVRRWEDSALGSYRQIIRAKRDRIFANPVADTTSEAGWGGAQLTNGRWWVTAQTIDPTDPNRDWYWNIRLHRDTVYLSPQTGRNRPRY
ncbi:MAG: hypothetical protein ACKVZ0_08490 [Gemmatimonadales bacterium]